MSNWKKNLMGDFDYNYIIEGVTSGFCIIDEGFFPVTAFSKNYKSATVANHAASEAQIQTEISLDRYIVAEQKPHVVSSIGAIPKSNGSVRLIHDLSRPDGGINSLTTDTAVKYPTIDDATRMIGLGSHIAKIDLSSAYRVVPIHPECFAYTGLSWKFGDDVLDTFLYDCRLPFGGSRSCRIFQALSNAVVRIMAKAGYFCIAYIDDYMVVGSSEIVCKQAFDYLIVLVQDLGFIVNWQKVSYPCTVLTFLGIEVDCVKRTLSLPDKKLVEAREMVCLWSKKVKATKRELQIFLGKLNWYSRVVRGGRSFMRNLINLTTKVTELHHHIRLSFSARQDIAWWSKGLWLFHGSTPFNGDIPLASHEFSTDACLVGGGTLRTVLVLCFLAGGLSFPLWGAHKCVRVKDSGSCHENMGSTFERKAYYSSLGQLSYGVSLE